MAPLPIKIKSSSRQLHTVRQWLTENGLMPKMGRLQLSANLSNDGYQFLGWYTNAACTGTSVMELPAESGRVTVYARWFDLSGRNSGLSQTIAHDFTTQ